MVSGPEMARLIGEFKCSTENKQDTDWRHHEQKKHAQMAFAQDVKSLSGTIEEMGNPFSENSKDLVLDSRNIAVAAVADTMCQIEKLGLDQYEAYMLKRDLSAKEYPLQNLSSGTFISSTSLQSERSHANGYSCHP